MLTMDSMRVIVTMWRRFHQESLGGLMEFLVYMLIGLVVFMVTVTTETRGGTLIFFVSSLLLWPFIVLTILLPNEKRGSK